MALSNPTPLTGYIVVEGNDTRELSAEFSRVSSKVTLKPITNASTHYKCGYTSVGPIAVGHSSYEGLMSVEREAGSDVLIFLPHQGRAAIKATGREIITSANRGAILDGHRQHGFLSLGPGQHFIVAIDRTALGNQLANMLDIPISGSLEFLPEIDLSSGTGKAIASMAATLQIGLSGDAPLRKAPLALASLSDAMMQVILEGLPHRFSAELSRGASPLPRHVKWAVEFMRANLSHPISLDEIAAASGGSRRALQEGFRQFKMTTPMAYLQYLRLEAVHQDLKNGRPGQTVADAALRWGFTHLGRFATDYRSRFGELPSQTLNSSRPAPANVCPTDVRK